jgi:hypothetical protein
MHMFDALPDSAKAVCRLFRGRRGDDSLRMAGQRGSFQGTSVSKETNR